ncbi:MAG: NAD(P)-dependent oxidoreductase [Chthoniobacteraceae bacterium]
MSFNLLSSSLDAAALKEILSSHPRKPLLPSLGDIRWSRIAENPIAAPWIKALRAKAEHECDKPFPELTDALYADFALTGRRSPFEHVYFERRRRLACAAVSLLFSNEGDGLRERLISSTISKLTSIFEEVSWALPAHANAGKDDPSGKEPLLIDLFCAETANLMAEMLDLVGAILPEDLKTCIRERLYSAVFINYLDLDFFWKKVSNNWNAVCHQGVLGAALSQVGDVDLLGEILLEVRTHLPAFLSGYGPDGGSSEGAGYWSYGFGWFAVLNEQLETRTGGELSLFANDDHVREIARFGPRMLLRGSRLVNFADGPGTGGLPPSLLSYLGDRLNERDCSAAALNEYRRIAITGLDLQAERADLFAFIRLLLFCPYDLSGDTPELSDCFLSDLGVLVAHGAEQDGHHWDFAAKAGHNGEHHNHNDCGSFILNIDGIRLISEIGAPEYVKDFFSLKRYEFLAARTLGHSLPIINGCEQAEGAERFSKVIAHELGEDCVSFSVDASACYPREAGCGKFLRTFHFEKKQGSLVLVDQFELERLESLESAIVASHPILLKGNEAVIESDGIRLAIHPMPGTLLDRVETHAYKDHLGVSSCIYRLVLVPACLAPRSTLGVEMALIPKKRAAFFGNDKVDLSRVYSQGRRQRIEELVSVYPETVSSENFVRLAPQLKDVEVIFGTWGIPGLTEEMFSGMPKLRAVFFSGGTVRSFVGTALDRGITVCSAWKANAIPVAEFTLAQILLANKGYFRNVEELLIGNPENPFTGLGNFGATVALLGAGQIGRKVIDLLRPFHLCVLVFDPFLSEAAAGELGVEKVSLEEAFQRGNVVSNHLANLPATVRMIQGHHLQSMPANATFINTGRGLTVAEDEMVEALKVRQDLTALLDVVANEMERNSSAPLVALPNVRVSHHIAGSLGDEVVRMADYMIEEFQRWENGEPLRYAVTKEMLRTMA